MFSKLFSWLKSLFSGSNNYDMYKPRERKIYSYYDGSKVVKADPMVIFKKIMDKAPEISIEMSVSTSISKDASKAHNDLIKRLRGIFNIKSLEEGGLSEAESIELFDHFMSYIDEVKKNSRNSVTPSVDSKASKSSSEESPPTASSSESGSTEREPSSEEQERLPTAVG